MTNVRWIVRRPWRAISASFALGAALALPACVGYGSYPPVKGDLAGHDTNSATMVDIMAASLNWTATRYAVDGAWAVSFPERTMRERAQQVLDRVDDADVFLLTEETQDLPVYAIGRIIVRGSEAELDLHRPVTAMGPGPGGVYPHQAVTLRLRGGLRPWRVESSQAWTIGTVATPTFNVYRDEAPPIDQTAASPEADPVPQMDPAEIADPFESEKMEEGAQEEPGPDSGPDGGPDGGSDGGSDMGPSR